MGRQLDLETVGEGIRWGSEALGACWRGPGQHTRESWLSELSALEALYLFVSSLTWLGCKVCC